MPSALPVSIGIQRLTIVVLVGIGVQITWQGAEALLRKLTNTFGAALVMASRTGGADQEGFRIAGSRLTLFKVHPGVVPSP
jgi:hypothetical protein